jgi:hypothetical protein
MYLLVLGLELEEMPSCGTHHASLRCQQHMLRNTAEWSTHCELRFYIVLLPACHMFTCIP